MKKILYIAIGLFAIAITSCKQNALQQTDNVAIGTKLKFFHAAAGVPALDAFVNGTQITPSVTQSVTDNGALSTSSIVTGYYYKNLFPGSNYAVVPSGSLNIKIAASSPVPALLSPQTVSAGTTVSNISLTTSDTSYYSLITAGLPGSPTTPLTTFAIKDVFPAPAANKAYVRIANMIPNLPKSVTLTGTYTPSGATAPIVVSPPNIAAYGSVSDFIALDVNTLLTTSYVFQAYQAGTTTPVGGTTTISLTPGRYYTLVAYGLYADYPVPGTNITLKATARPTTPTTDPTIHYPEIYFNVIGVTFYTTK